MSTVGKRRSRDARSAFPFLRRSNSIAGRRSLPPLLKIMDKEGEQNFTLAMPTSGHSKPTPKKDNLYSSASEISAAMQEKKGIFENNSPSTPESGTKGFRKNGKQHRPIQEELEKFPVTEKSESKEGEVSANEELESPPKLPPRKDNSSANTAVSAQRSPPQPPSQKPQIEKSSHQISVAEGNETEKRGALSLDNPLYGTTQASKDPNFAFSSQLPPKKNNSSESAAAFAQPPSPQPPSQMQEDRKLPPLQPPPLPRESNQSAESHPTLVPGENDEKPSSSSHQPPFLVKESDVCSREFSHSPLQNPQPSQFLSEQAEKALQFSQLQKEDCSKDKSSPTLPIRSIELSPQFSPNENSNPWSNSPPQYLPKERVQLEKVSDLSSRESSHYAPSQSPQSSCKYSSTSTLQPSSPPSPLPSPLPSSHSRGSDNYEEVIVMAPEVLADKERVQQKSFRNVEEVASAPVEVEPAIIEQTAKEEIVDSLDFLEENYEKIEKGDFAIVDRKCCDCCLKCSVSCFRLLKCCDCMERCSRRGKVCIACGACSGKQFSDGEKEAFRNGLLASIKFIGPPSKWALIFWRSFELSFFIFSLVYAAIAASQGFDDKRSLKVVNLVLTLLDLIFSIYENGRQWKEIFNFYRDKKKQNRDDLEKSKIVENRDSKARGSSKFVHELALKYVVHALMYPLIICDIYDIASEANGKGTFEYFVIGIGCLLTVVDVYLHRIYLLIKASRDIGRKRMFGPERTDRVPCFRIECRLAFHITCVMILHAFILASIAFEAIETNQDRIEGDEVNISGVGIFMIACGFCLPFISMVIFVGTNVFWIRTYFIEIFKSIWEQGESLGEGLNMRKKTRLYNSFETIRSFDAKSYRFIDRIKMSCSDWRTITIAVVYTGLMIALVVLSSINQPISTYGLAATTLVADLIALSITFYWLFVLTIILTVVAIVAGLAVPGAFCVLALRRSKYNLFDYLFRRRENEVVKTVTTVPLPQSTAQPQTTVFSSYSSSMMY